MAKKVLLADDSATIQKLVEMHLSDSGFELLAVSDGKQAIEQLPEFQPDIVLADAIMPLKDGYQVCEFVKNDSQFSHIPVILMTGRFQPFDEARATEVAIDERVVKPFTQGQLVSTMTRLLEEAGPAPEPPAPQIPDIDTSDFGGPPPAAPQEESFDDGATIQFSPEELRARLQSVQVDDDDEEIPSMDAFDLDNDNPEDTLDYGSDDEDVDEPMELTTEDLEDVEPLPEEDDDDVLDEPSSFDPSPETASAFDPAPETAAALETRPVFDREEPSAAGDDDTDMTFELEESQVVDTDDILEDAPMMDVADDDLSEDFEEIEPLDETAFVDDSAPSEELDTMPLEEEEAADAGFETNEFELDDEDATLSEAGTLLDDEDPTVGDVAELDSEDTDFELDEEDATLSEAGSLLDDEDPTVSDATDFELDDEDATLSEAATLLDYEDPTVSDAAEALAAESEEAESDDDHLDEGDFEELDQDDLAAMEAEFDDEIDDEQTVPVVFEELSEAQEEPEPISVPQDELVEDQGEGFEVEEFDQPLLSETPLEVDTADLSDVEETEVDGDVEEVPELEPEGDIPELVPEEDIPELEPEADLPELDSEDIPDLAPEEDIPDLEPETDVPDLSPKKTSLNSVTKTTSRPLKPKMTNWIPMIWIWKRTTSWNKMRNCRSWNRKRRSPSSTRRKT